MPVVPFREMLTLSDAVELVGRRLYDETWSGWEYASQPRKSPEEIASERKPLEEELSAAEAEIREVEAAILKAINANENRRLAARRDKLETRIRQLHTTPNRDHPLKEILVDAYTAHVRCKTATETFLEAINGFKLKVHNGRGQELNRAVWTHPKFRYYLDLSIVINPRSSGEPRRQAARINRDEFDNWLATLKPIVEAKHERSAEERLTEFLRQKIAGAGDGPHENKDQLREQALAQIPGARDRMFDRVWSNIVPEEWRKAGAPPKARRSR
jgi:hypothetical protein